mmetsp:Transcript_43892/g.42420  ORF Transcript_43892/g.42420 Transcript_43892/m.42420 type:complete len:89 (+) Transcript_43892:732-998(+)
MIAVEALFIIYLLAVRPFNSTWRLVQEVVNECIIVICFGLMFMLTPLFNTDETRYNVGYALFGVIIFALFINLIFVIVEIVSNIIRIC